MNKFEKIEKMLFGISIMIFGSILMSISPDDEKKIIFLVPLSGFGICLYSYFNNKKQ